MKQTKRALIRQFLEREAKAALLLRSTRLSNRPNAEYERLQASDLAAEIAGHIVYSDYVFLELCDIFDWKTRAVRR